MFINNSFKKVSFFLSERSNRNIISSIFTKIFVSFIALIFVPIYVSIIGLDYFGIIAIFTIVSSIFGIFDLGISNSLNRLIAVNIEDSSSLSTLINQTKALEILYWMIGLALTLIFISLSGFIANQLAASETFSPQRMHYIIIIFAILFFIQWPTNFYSAGLYGLQRHSLLNFSNVAMLLLRNFLGLAYLRFYDNSIEGFLIWQCIGYSIWAFVLFIIFHRILPKSNIKFKFSFNLIRELIPFAKGLFFISIFTVLITQFDKIVLSKLIPIEQLGIYGISAIAASTVQYYAAGFYTAMFPKFSSLSSASHKEELKYLFNKVTLICSVLTFSTMSVFIFYSSELIYLWTKNSEIVDSSRNIIIILTIGTALHSQSNLFLALQLSKKEISIPIYKNMIMLALLLPTSIFFIRNYGVIGAAMSWLSVSTLTFIFEPIFTYNKLLGKNFNLWLISSSLAPLLSSLLIVFLLSNITFSSSNQFLILLQLLIVFLSSLIGSFYISSKLKFFLMNHRH